VNEDPLWAPWRLGYVTGNESTPVSPLPEPLSWEPDADRSCFLCRDAATYDQALEIDRRLLVVDRGRFTITVLNRYPYNNGHLLVAPRRHVGDLPDLSRDEHIECLERIGNWIRTYRKLLNAEGFNIGLNLGRVAGAGVPSHLHWHLVPRWASDHNFMPVLAGVRVIPQSLDSLWEMLTDVIPGKQH
jgi:ATP adenylyltransferase